MSGDDSGMGKWPDPFTKPWMGNMETRARAPRVVTRVNVAGSSPDVRANNAAHVVIHTGRQSGRDALLDELRKNPCAAGHRWAYLAAGGMACHTCGVRCG